MIRTFWLLAALVLAAFLLSACGPGNSITSPDVGADVGQHTSVFLDSNGYPVVSYYDVNGTFNNGDLKVLHCGNAECTSGNSITSPDTGGDRDVGQYSSLALDSNGFPVVSYYDADSLELMVMHCNDANCAGGDEIITGPDPGGHAGQYTSLALDGSGYPVVSYYDVTSKDLKVLHCGNANCTSGNTITSPDTGGDVGQYTSLALAVWYEDEIPVVSYYDVTNGDLKVLRCGDANCSSGNTITSPDTTGNVGAYTSLAWGGGESYYPVISYYDVTNGDLKVLYCGDNHCGSENTIESPDTTGAVGAYTSLAMMDGLPMVSYYDLDNGNLKVLSCGNADCSSGNSIASPDTTGNVGQYTSLALDGDTPVVTYYDADHGTLKVLVSDDITTADGGGSVGEHTSLALDRSGRPVVSYYDGISKDLKVLRCGNANCTAGNSITSPDVEAEFAHGLGTSLFLDTNDHPVISYYEGVSQDLKVMHCNDPNCAGGNESITSPVSIGESGVRSSLFLDDDGYPVISYYDSHLYVLHCGNANCTAGNSITEPDTDDVGQYSSLWLDSNGFPVISYYDYLFSHRDLKVMHCNDVNCAGSNETITSPDTTGDVGWYTSLRLDSSGYPVVSYYDATNGDLKVMHCNDVNCDPNVPEGSGAESIASPDQTDDVGQYTSLRLDSSGYPVVSYYDVTNGNLKVLHCGDANCTSGNALFPADTPGDVGQYTSLRLDTSGNPVVGYYDVANGDLKVMHCGLPGCTPGAYPSAGTDELPVTLTFDNVYLDQDHDGVPEFDAGAVTFTGTGKFERSAASVIDGYNTINTKVLSLVLKGNVNGDQVTIKAGTQQGLAESPGKIREQTPGTAYPADTWFDLFFEVDSPAPYYDGTRNCEVGGVPQAVRFTGVTSAIPVTYVEYHVTSCPVEPPPSSCVVGCGESSLMIASGDYDVYKFLCWRDYAASLSMSVGGIAEWPSTAAETDLSADSSAGSGSNHAVLAGALAAVAVALATGAWLTRRRRVR